MAENVITIKGQILKGSSSGDDTNKGFVFTVKPTDDNLIITGDITYESDSGDVLSYPITFVDGILGFGSDVYDSFTLNIHSADKLLELKISAPKCAKVEFESDSLTQATSLRWIYFVNVTLPAGFIADNFTKLKDLRSVSIFAGSSKKPVNLAEFEQLTQLIELVLCDYVGNIYGNISSLSNLTNLKLLNLEAKNIYGNLSSLSGLTNLQELYIEHCNVLGDVRSLTPMEKMQHLTLNDLLIVGDINFFEKFEKLCTIRISKCGLTGTLFLKAITASKNLFVVHLNNLNINGAIENFSKANLITLDLENTMFDGDVASLKTNEGLRTLLVCNTSVSGDAAALNDNPKLKIFRRHHSNVSGTWTRKNPIPDKNGANSRRTVLNMIYDRSNKLLSACWNLIREMNGGMYNLVCESEDVDIQNVYNDYKTASELYISKVTEFANQCQEFQKTICKTMDVNY